MVNEAPVPTYHNGEAGPVVPRMMGETGDTSALVGMVQSKGLNCEEIDLISKGEQVVQKMPTQYLEPGEDVCQVAVDFLVAGVDAGT